MSAPHWLADPWVRRLGWTLIQFLWQGAVIAGVFAGVRATCARWLSSSGRYALACATLALMTLAPILTFIAGAGLGNASARWFVPVTSGWDSFMPGLVVVWLAGVLVCSVRLLGAWLAAHRLRTVGVRPAPAEWQETFGRLVRRLDIPQRVRLLVSPRVDVPVVVGWLRPVVLVPVGALTGLPPEYVTALLAHELAHVCRRDYLVNLLQRVAEALLFYHPAVWWVSNQIRVEREMCCDDIAVAAHGDPLVYARALTELDASRRVLSNLELAANGASLLDRIRRLLGQTTSVSRLMPAPGSLAGIVGLWLVGIAAVQAQGMRVPETPRPQETTVIQRPALLATAMFGPVGPAAPKPTPSQSSTSSQSGQPGSVAPPAPPAPLDRFAKGTAIIRGRVLRLDTGTPLRRARVTLRRSGLAEPPAAVTDDQGRYELREIPAGRFTVIAIKDGFVAAEYGQNGAGASGRPIELSDGQVFERADVVIASGSVLTGQILDDAGEPQGGVTVRALKQQFVDGVAVPGPAAGTADVTDDLGRFRLFGLTGGDYFVGAVAGEAGSSDFLGTSVISFERATKTFHPGTTRANEARPVRVGAGQEVGGLIFSVSPRRGFRISGTVISGTGQPAIDARLSLTQEGMSGGRAFATVRLRPDGSFTSGELSPGEYTLVVDLPSDKALAARAQVVLENADAVVNLVLKRGDTLRGRIVFDAGSSRESIQPSSVRLSLDGPGSTFQMAFSGIPVRDDWSFEASGLTGEYRLQGRLPQGWTIRSVRHTARDVTDSSLEFAGADVEGVEVMLTQRVTSVSGLVSDARGQRLLDATVIVLADDPAKWMPQSRYVQRTRLDDKGRFVIQGLPPGRYVATAVTGLPGRAEESVEVLSRLRQAGVRLTLNDGESRNLDLRVVAVP